MPVNPPGPFPSSGRGSGAASSDGNHPCQKRNAGGFLSLRGFHFWRSRRLRRLVKKCRLCLRLGVRIRQTPGNGLPVGRPFRADRDGPEGPSYVTNG